MKSDITGKEDGSMSRTGRGIAAAAGFCLFLALVLFVTAAVVYNIAGDSAQMAVEMNRHAPPKVSGLPEDQYVPLAERITGYLTGRQSVFQFYFTDADGNMTVCFQAHEADHMADCRRLIRLAGQLRWYLAGAVLILIVTGFALRKQRKSFSTGMIAGFGAASVACIAILIWAITNFDSFFTAFHKLFFTNDGWILNSRTDMLIRLMPTSFFASLGIKVLLGGAAVALAALSAAVIIRMTGNKEEEKEDEKSTEQAPET